MGEAGRWPLRTLWEQTATHTHTHIVLQQCHWVSVGYKGWLEATGTQRPETTTASAPHGEELNFDLLLSLLATLTSIYFEKRNHVIGKLIISHQNRCIHILFKLIVELNCCCNIWSWIFIKFHAILHGLIFCPLGGSRNKLWAHTDMISHFKGFPGECLTSGSACCRRLYIRSRRIPYDITRWFMDLSYEALTSTFWPSPSCFE